MAILHSILRAFQLFLIILTLALSGALVNQQVIGGSPAQINFALFVSIFAILCCFYYSFSIFAEGHPMILLILDTLNTLFTLCAGIALAARLGVHSCGNWNYVSKNPLTNGSFDPTKRCHEAQALTAFMWFLFVTFLVSLGYAAWNFRRAGAPTVSSRSRV